MFLQAKVFIEAKLRETERANLFMWNIRPLSAWKGTGDYGRLNRDLNSLIQRRDAPFLFLHLADI